MTKETLLVLCASLCLGFSTPFIGGGNDAFAQSKETRKALTTAHTSADSHSGEHGLLADRLEIKKKISTHRRLRDMELKKELEQANLQAPSEELYGDDSWTSRVNPFAGMSANIPNSYDINLDGFFMPIERRQITSNFGYRAAFGRNHYGTDMALSVGDTVKAAFSGKVRIASYEGGGYGNYVVIRHTNGLETVYGHLSRRIVTEGTVVRAGDPIGLGGSTGRSTGPHLHFEARFMGIPLNPSDLFDLILGAPRLDKFTFYKSEHARVARRPVYAQRASVTKSDSPSDAAPQVHKIKKGDTLHSLAKHYGTTVAKLQELNGLQSNKLKVGKSIRIA
jgi:peptidase, M23/M37 family